MNKTLVLLSGGQDSTTCLFWAKHRMPRLDSEGPFELHALSMFYGQRHKAELEAASRIAELAGCVTHEVMNVDALMGAKSALTSSAPIASSGGMVDAAMPEGLPTTFVPGRNLVFLALAVAHAARIGATAIVTGVCQTDYSGYPDCRMEFIHAMQEAVNQAWPSGVPAPRILVPLMRLTKAQTVTMMLEIAQDGLSLAQNDHTQAPAWKALGMSITCYNGKRPGCGKCPACELRIKGFEAAGVADPSRAAQGDPLAMKSLEAIKHDNAAKQRKAFTPKHLGKQSRSAVDTLDLIPWKGGHTVITLNATEFTSHCPVTKQPDFGSLVIEYCPNKHIIETKSIKLFLWQYRHRAQFNEVIVDELAEVILAQVKPVWVKVTGAFNLRGGISVTAIAERYTDGDGSV